LVAQREGGYLFRNNGLHIEVVIDRSHPVGATDPLGIADVLLESALTTICDLEDSVAAVDAEDKLLAYSQLAGRDPGRSGRKLRKGRQTLTRTLNPDRVWGDLVLPGRSLLFVRNVGHLMTNPAILLADGSEIPEGIMDAVLTSAIGALAWQG
jgi:malate synthase